LTNYKCSILIVLKKFVTLSSACLQYIYIIWLIDPPSKVKWELSIGSPWLLHVHSHICVKIVFVIKIKLIFLGVSFSSLVQKCVFFLVLFESTSWAPSFNFIHMVFQCQRFNFSKSQQDNMICVCFAMAVFQDFLSYKTKVYVFYVFRYGHVQQHSYLENKPLHMFLRVSVSSSL